MGEVNPVWGSSRGGGGRLVTAATAAALLLAAAFGVHGILMIVPVPVMRAGAASVGFTLAQYRCIGLLEVAAAAGLLAGLQIPAFGLAAAAGLIALMTAAVIVHARNRDPVWRMAPAITLGLLALVYVALSLSQLR